MPKITKFRRFENASDFETTIADLAMEVAALGLPVVIGTDRPLEIGEVVEFPTGEWAVVVREVSEAELRRYRSTLRRDYINFVPPYCYELRSD